MVHSFHVPRNNARAWVSLFAPLQCYPIGKFLSIVLPVDYICETTLKMARHDYLMSICILFYLALLLCYYSATRKISTSHTRPSMWRSNLSQKCYPNARLPIGMTSTKKRFPKAIRDGNRSSDSRLEGTCRLSYSGLSSPWLLVLSPRHLQSSLAMFSTRLPLSAPITLIPKGFIAK